MPAKPYVWNGVDTWLGVGLADIPVTGNTNSRDNLVYGQYKPDASTVGPLSGIVFTTIGTSSTTVNYNATANNQVIENLEVWGSINVGTYSNVTVRNCIIHGPLTRGVSSAHIQGSGDNLRGATIVDCSLIGRSYTVPASYNGVANPDAGNVNNANEWCEGMRGGNYTILRCEVQNIPDGIGLTSSVGNVTIKGCWIHNGWMNEWVAAQTSSGYYPPHPSYYVHTDGVQFHLGKNYTIVGNRIGGLRVPGNHHQTPSQKDVINSGDDLFNSNFMIQQENYNVNNPAAVVENVLIDRNWLAGSACTVNLAYKNSNTLSSVVVSNNKFMRSTWGTQKYVLRDTVNGVGLATLSGNVFEDDGSAIPISQGNAW